MSMFGGDAPSSGPLGKTRGLDLVTVAPELVPEAVQDVSAGSRGGGDRKAYGKLNTVTGWILVAVVLLAAVPAASNRPVFWMGWAAFLMLLALVHLVLGARLDAGRPLRLWDHKPLLMGIAVIPIWALLQAVPGLGGIASDLPLPDALQPATVSVAPHASIMAALRITSYLIFFALVLEVASRADRAERLAWAVFLGVAALTLYGLAALSFFGDTFFWGDKSAYEGFATGTFINRNAFASFIGMGMCLGLALTLRRVRRKQIRDSYGRHRQKHQLISADFVVLAVVLALMAITLILTGSRMGAAASAVGLMVVFVTMEAKSGVRLRTIGLRMAAIVAVLLVVLLPVYGLDIIWRFVFVESAALTRGAVYASLLQMIADRPILGYGLDAFEPAFEIFHGKGVLTHVTWEYAHSTYLGNWMELGLIVGSLPLVIAALAALRLIRLIARRSTGVALPISALGALCLLAVHATVDFSFETQANLFLLLFILGLGLASRNAQSSEAA